jgi:type I restriction enzyme S subunit
MNEISLDMSLLPTGWKKLPISELAIKIRSGGTPRRTSPEFWGGDVPFALIEDMTSCSLFLNDTKERITNEGLNNSSAWIVPPGSMA